MPFVVDNSVVSGWYIKEQAADAVALMTKLPITVERAAVLADALFALALRYGLSSYDAAYLDLAIRLKLPIAAKDGALRNAAEAAGVGVVVE